LDLRERRQQEDGEKYIMRRFIICNIGMNHEVMDEELDRTCTPNLRHQKFIHIFVGKPQRNIPLARCTRR
jgi:hypothetical protein